MSACTISQKEGTYQLDVLLKDAAEPRLAGRHEAWQDTQAGTCQRHIELRDEI
jgi:hypothetical protein